MSGSAGPPTAPSTQILEDDSDMDTQEDSIPPGVTGLVNLGNTCYLNTSVQMLAACAPLRQVLLSMSPSMLNDSQYSTDDTLSASAWLSRPRPFVRQLRQLVSTMWQSSDFEYVNPKRLLQLVHATSQIFVGYSQEDAEEFLRFLLAKLDEELAFPIDGPPPHGRAPLRSVITDIFGGRLSINITCQDCNKVSTSHDDFSILSLELTSPAQSHKSSSDDVAGTACADSASAASSSGPSWRRPGSLSIPVIHDSVRGVYDRLTASMGSFGRQMSSRLLPDGQAVSLEDCFAALCHAETMTGDNSYSCDHCKRRTTARRQVKIQQLPNVLCLSLKRFKYTGDRPIKLRQPVKFPLNDLDLAQFVQKNESESLSEAKYELVSVICHHGSAQSGHYTSYVRNPFDSHWYFYDDTSVRPSRAGDVEMETSSAYILLYRRISRQQERLCEKLQEMAALQAHRHDVNVAWVSRLWINVMLNTARPGPVRNWDFACRHGRGHPDASGPVRELAVPVPEDAWMFLMKHYGGGPKVVTSKPCHECQRTREDLLKQRQRHARSVEQRFHKHQPDPSVRWYAISKPWFREWERFVSSMDADYLLPPPVDNKNLVDSTGRIKPHLKEGLHFQAVPKPAWDLLKDLYGGGPAVEIPVSMPLAQRAMATDGDSDSSQPGTEDPMEQ